MEKLIEGYRRFRAEVWPAERDRYEALAKRGQSPDTMIVSCSDSRVDPQTVFGAGPGEMFVLRNVAGLVPPYSPDTGYHGTSAALEYAVRVLKVARIVVLGHAQCGGVQALVQGAPKEAADFVQPWMELAAPVMRSVPAGLAGDDLLAHCENRVVGLSLDNLMSFPWIADAVNEGHLRLYGYKFGVKNGVLARIDNDRLVPVD